MYRKLRYCMKVFEEFQALSYFSIKMVLYPLTKFGILSTGRNILWPRTIDLAFWQKLKQVYRKLECKYKVFEEFQGLSRFLGKVVFCSSTKFGILKPWTNVSSPRKFYLGSWMTPKQIHRKQEYREKVYEQFQGISCFPRRMALYSSTKLVIIKPWTNIHSFRRLHLGFDRLQKKFITIPILAESFFRVPRFVSLSQKICLVFLYLIWHSKAVNQ